MLKSMRSDPDSISAVLQSFEKYYFQEKPMISEMNIKRLFMGDSRDLHGLVQLMGSTRPNSVAAIALIKLINKLLEF